MRLGEIGKLAVKSYRLGTVSDARFSRRCVMAYRRLNAVHFDAGPPSTARLRYALDRRLGLLRMTLVHLVLRATAESKISSSVIHRVAVSMVNDHPIRDDAEKAAMKVHPTALHVDAVWAGDAGGPSYGKMARIFWTDHHDEPLARRSPGMITAFAN